RVAILRKRPAAEVRLRADWRVVCDLDREEKRSRLLLGDQRSWRIGGRRHHQDALELNRHRPSIRETHVDAEGLARDRRCHRADDAAASTASCTVGAWRL